MERIQAAIQKAKAQRGGRAAPPPRMPTAFSDAATAAWEALPAFEPDQARMRRERIVAYARDEAEHATFDLMRTKLLRTLRENNWRTVAITSPTASCGKTMATLNLGFSLGHQPDSRTVVLDMDLRRPTMARMLGLETHQHSMAAFLAGKTPARDNMVRWGKTLALGTNARAVRHPSELFHHEAAHAALETLKSEFQPQVILCDTPPMLANDDVLAFLPHVDCVLLVAAAEQSTMEQIDNCERELAEQTNVLGVVLNKCRYTPDDYGYY